MMPVLLCDCCSQPFEPKSPPRGAKHYCSNACQYKQKSIDQSDQYTPFRWMYRKAKSRSKFKGREFSITLEELPTLWDNQGRVCNLTGLELDFGDTSSKREHGEVTASLDRIDSDKGYTSDNIQIIHKTLNDLKSNFKENDLIYWSRLIAEHTAGREVTKPLDRITPVCYTSDCEDETPF